MIENLHANHRKRLRQRFSQHGLLSFEDHNLLELLLFYVIPRADTNPIAHRLLGKFGSLKGIFEAEESELCEVDGVGETTAEYLKLCGAVAREEALSELKSLALDKKERLGTFFQWFFCTLPYETSAILLLDEKHRYINCEVINIGKDYRPACVCESAVEYARASRCAYAVLAHTHPTFDLTPSDEDVFIFQRVETELKKSGIVLDGSYILHSFDYISYDSNQQ